MATLPHARHAGSIAVIRNSSDVERYVESSFHISGNRAYAILGPFQYMRSTTKATRLEYL